MNITHSYTTLHSAPNLTEVNVPSLEVLEGTCPSDVSGVYLRNTEQPTHEPLGNYHPFDGDAMLHQVSLDGSGKCSYRNRCYLALIHFLCWILMNVLLFKINLSHSFPCIGILEML